MRLVWVARGDIRGKAGPSRLIRSLGFKCKKKPLEGSKPAPFDKTFQLMGMFYILC